MKPELLGTCNRPWVNFVLALVAVAAVTVIINIIIWRQVTREPLHVWEPAPDLSTVHADRCYIAIDGDLRCRLMPRVILR